MKIGQSAGKSFAYILGVYLGDGNVSRHLAKNWDGVLERFSQFRLNTIDLDFAEAVRTALIDLTGRKITIHTYAVSKSSKPNNALSCGDEELCNKLVIDTEGKSYIPSYVFDWSKEEKLAFVAGLMDSEGFISKKHGSNVTYYMGFKCCESWVYDFARLLNTVGIQVGKTAECPPYKAHYKTPIRFHIKLPTWVNAGAYFKIKRKQDRVEIWKNCKLSSTTNMLEAA